MKKTSTKLRPLSQELPDPPTSTSSTLKPLTSEDYLLHAPSLKLYLYLKNLKFGDLTSPETHEHFEKFIKKYNSLEISSIFYPERDQVLFDKLLGEVNKNSSGWAIKQTKGEASFISSLRTSQNDTERLKAEIGVVKKKPVINRPKITARGTIMTNTEICQPIATSGGGFKGGISKPSVESEGEKRKREEREKVLASIGMSGIKKVSIKKRND